MRRQLVKTVTKILEDDPRVVLLLGDIGVYGFREAFEKFPTRVYNIGILEQASVGVAAGLAIEGMIPIFHTIAPFMVERALEQLKIDFGYQGLGGNFISVGGSYDYSKLGCTHHCPGDVQALKTIPNAKIFVPGHSSEFDQDFRINYDAGTLNYFRLSERSNQRGYHNGLFLQKGRRGTVAVFGPMADRVSEACEGLDVSVLYYNDLSELHTHANVVVEPFYEGTLAYDMPNAFYIGVPRKFLTNYGAVEELDQDCRLTADQIRNRVKGYLNL